MTALDCRSPRSITSGLVSEICTTPKDTTEEDEEPVLLLQYSTKRTITGYKCTKMESRLTEVCGAFSHSKILSPPDILQPTLISPEECQTMVTRGIYLREDGSSIPVAPNQIHSYKYIQHGSLTVSEDNVACQGSQVSINGEIHSAIVELVSTRITFKEIKIEVDIGKAVDLDSHEALPVVCSRETLCQAGTTAYVIEHPENNCPLFTIRTVAMKKININTDHGIKTALISREHKILLTLTKQEAAHSECRPIFTIQATTYPDLKVVTKQQAVASIANLAQHMEPSVVDLELEFRTSTEFLAYVLEEALQTNVKAVGQKMCKMGSHRLSEAELSPFHKNSLIRIRGDLIQEIPCTTVQAEIRIGDQRGDLCSLDSIPAWLNNQPIYIQTENHLVVEEADISKVDCKASYPPVFVTKDKKNNRILLQANPEVQTTDIQIHHFENYLHLTEQTEHLSFSEDLLYTHEEMAQFNDLLHFQRTKKRVLNSLVAQYCRNNPDCGEYQTGSAASAFDLDALEDEVTSPFAFLGEWKEDLQIAGSYCSIIILLAVILTLMYKIIHVFWLTCKHKLGLGQALRLGLFVNHTMINALLQAPVNTSSPIVDRRPSEPRTSERALPQEEMIPLQRRRPALEQEVTPPASTALVPIYHEYSWTQH